MSENNKNLLEELYGDDLNPHVDMDVTIQALVSSKKLEEFLDCKNDLYFSLNELAKLPLDALAKLPYQEGLSGCSLSDDNLFELERLTKNISSFKEKMRTLIKFSGINPRISTKLAEVN